MADIPEHINWLVDTGDRLSTADGKTVEVWELRHQPDDKVLSAWAKHFRQHYCLDSQIDELRAGTPHSRSEYLICIKFPDVKVAPGPSIRAGDFGEILVADFLEYILGFWVPRTRYSNKTNRNESTKGCDILGFRFIKDGKESPKDMFAIFESKTQFSGKKPKAKLQEAVDGSIKDQIRKAESLNAIRQRFLDSNNKNDARRVQRFQNPEDRPYREVSGASALFVSNLFDQDLIKSTVTQLHPNHNKLKLIVIRGQDMMNLVHKLYQRAADEA